MKIEALKEKLLGHLGQWLEERIDGMVRDNPTMAVPAVYMKRGCCNIIKKYGGKISDSIDNAALFLADENGNIGIDTLFADMTGILRETEETNFDIGMVKGTVGKGKIAINIPENILTNIIFGSKKTITLNEEDIMELKALLTAS